MNELQAVFSRLNDVEATIAKVERGGTPETLFAQELALRSLRARRDELRSAADALAERKLVDVCDYRILPDASGNYPVKAVAGVIDSFQDMFTAFFASIRENRPRHKAAFDQSIVQSSTMNFGFAYSGSLGIVLYIPSDQLLPSDGDPDMAIHAIFDLVGQQSAEGVRDIAQRYGRAPVRRFYEWSKVHLDYGLSADIKWMRGDELKEQRLVQPAELKSIMHLIDAEVDKVESVETLDGILVGLDVTRLAFKLSFPNASDIHGTFDEMFNWKIPHEIPGRYRATVRKSVVTPLWSGTDSITYSLIDLQAL